MHSILIALTHDQDCISSSDAQHRCPPRTILHANNHSLWLCRRVARSASPRTKKQNKTSDTNQTKDNQNKTVRKNGDKPKTQNARETNMDCLRWSLCSLWVLRQKHKDITTTSDKSKTRNRGTKAETRGPTSNTKREEETHDEVWDDRFVTRSGALRKIEMIVV